MRSGCLTLRPYSASTGSRRDPRPHPSEDQASKSSGVGGSASSSKKFGPLSDELSLLVDKELGVPLRSAVMVAGEEISSSEIVEIAFDEPIPAALFRPLR